VNKLPVISFKKKINKKDIKWIENGGREKIWKRQKELNSQSINREENDFISIYICTPSMKKELEKAREIKQEMKNNLKDNEVFFRIKYKNKKNLDKAIEYLFKPTPKTINAEKWFKENKNTEKHTKENRITLKNETITCSECNKTTKDITNWHLTQLYNPTTEQQKELTWICQKCSKKIQTNNLKGLKNISKRYSLIDQKKIECNKCKKETKINKAENWWILQLIQVQNNGFGIGNITTYCPNCKNNIKINTLNDIKNLIQKLDPSKPPRNRKPNKNPLKKLQ